MKKVLALVLAVMMLTSLAFAAAINVVPGYEIELGKDTEDVWDDAPDKKVNSDNYSISKIDWEEGKKYIDSVSFDDDDNVLVIKVKQNYTLVEDDGASFYGTVKIREKGKSKYHTANITNNGETPTASTQAIPVFYAEGDITIDPDRNATFTDAEGEPCECADGTLYTVRDEYDKAYGTFEEDFGSDKQYGVSVRVYEDEELFLETSEEADKDILKANADADADYIDFVEWVAHPTFTSNVTLEFYGAEEDDYIYEIKDGKLVTPSRLKWDDDAEVWTLTTRTLGAYVVSDVKLAKAVAEADSGVNNPDTGANDVVGIAGALAVVAMISAAAVSLKK